MNIVEPVRASRRYIQHLVASPAAVFPLLCPVREADWIDGWDPVRVVSSSGVAERDCAFITETATHNAIWYITRHEPENGFVEMLKITPGLTACRISIVVRGVGTGSEAEICYTHTSLGDEGDTFVAGFTEAWFREFMQDWETRINHYLTTGTRLAG